MKMIRSIDKQLIAICGVNCLACSAYLNNKTPCRSCRAPKEQQTRKSCTNCAIKNCATEKHLQWCFECEHFPCVRIKNLSKRYQQNYGIDLIQNGIDAKQDWHSFLHVQRLGLTCQTCGGIIDQHHKKCSECGEDKLTS